MTYILKTSELLMHGYTYCLTEQMYQLLPAWKRSHYKITNGRGKWINNHRLNNTNMKPISPDEVVQKKRESLREEVIEAVNEMITEHWNGHESRFIQDSLIERIISKWKRVYENKQELRLELFNKHYLDIGQKDGQWSMTNLDTMKVMRLISHSKDKQKIMKPIKPEEYNRQLAQEALSMYRQWKVILKKHGKDKKVQNSIKVDLSTINMN